MTIVSCKLYLCVFTNGILSLAGPKSTYLTHGALLLQLVTLALRECPLGLGKLIDPAILHYPRGAQVDGAQGGGSLMVSYHACSGSVSGLGLSLLGLSQIYVIHWLCRRGPKMYVTMSSYLTC